MVGIGFPSVCETSKTFPTWKVMYSLSSAVSFISGVSSAVSGSVRLYLCLYGTSILIPVSPFFT